MPDGMKIRNGLWMGEDGSFVLPAMIGRHGARHTVYLVPLRAVGTNGRGTLVFDAEAVRAALGDLEHQVNSRRGYKDVHHRQVRRKKRW